MPCWPRPNRPPVASIPGGPPPWCGPCWSYCPPWSRLQKRSYYAAGWRGGAMAARWLSSISASGSWPGPSPMPSTITPFIDQKCWPPGALASSWTEPANRCGPCSTGSRCSTNCWPPASASPPSPCGCGGRSSCSGSGWKRAYRGRRRQRRLRIWRPCRCRARSGCLV